MPYSYILNLNNSLISLKDLLLFSQFFRQRMKWFKHELVCVCFSDVLEMACSMRTSQSTVVEKKNELTNRTEEKRRSKNSTLSSFFYWLWFLKPGRKISFGRKRCFGTFLVKEFVFRSFWRITIFCSRKAVQLAGLKAFFTPALKNKAFL